MTRSITFFRHLLPALLLLSLLAACKKTDFQDTELAGHSAEFAFPLFTTDLFLKDLLSQVLNDSVSDDSIHIDPDGTMTLFYTGDVAEKKATDIFSFFDDKFVPMTDSLGELSPGITGRRHNQTGKTQSRHAEFCDQ